jgi:hypothetical protein
MHPKRHVFLTQISFIIFFLVALLLGPAILNGLQSDKLDTTTIIVLILFGITFLSYIIIWNLPVKCVTSNCNTHMFKVNMQISFFKAKLLYWCKNCEYKYEEYIFHILAGDWRD